MSLILMKSPFYIMTMPSELPFLSKVFIITHPSLKEGQDNQLVDANLRLAVSLKHYISGSFRIPYYVVHPHFLRWCWEVPTSLLSPTSVG